MRRTSVVTKSDAIGCCDRADILPEHAMRVPLITWDSEHVVYRGEGNSSLVVALKHDKHVIRLLKTSQPKKKCCEAEIPSLLKTNIRFSDRIVSQIFARAFFHSPQLIRLSEEQLNQLEVLVRDQRPLFRRSKTIAGHSLALLLPDYCCLPRVLSEHVFGPLIAVEIKPKQGFLPDRALLDDETRAKAHVCRYGLSQCHKLKKGSIHARSLYCPLDLFSGCHARQTRALHALIQSPQNNFRVFRDLNPAFGDQSDNTLDDVIGDVFLGQSETERRDNFCKLLVSALNRPLTQRPPLLTQLPRPQTCALHTNACTCQTEHALRAGSVLYSILCGQRLDSIDSRLADEMWAWLQSNNNNNNEGEGLQSRLNGDWLPKEWSRVERLEEETESEYFLRKVWQFLVSLTVKDCSIMIAIQRTEERTRDQHVFAQNGFEYAVSCHVTDLDRKPTEKIGKTLLNDKRMVRAAMQSSINNCRLMSISS